MGIASLAVKAAKKAAAEVAEKTAAKVVKRALPAAADLAVQRPIKAPAFTTPAIIGKADPGQRILQARAAQMDLPAKERLKPTGTDPVFDTSIDSYRRTSQILPQSDPAEVQSRLPRQLNGKAYPGGNRMGPVMDRAKGISEMLADRIGQRGDDMAGYFYHTGPVVEGAADAGVPMDRAIEWLQKEFAPAFAGTSPRTNTAQNMRNATLLNYLRKSGAKIDENTYEEQGNLRGYPMLGTHYALTDRMWRGAHDPLVNPKPSAFGPNVGGDLSHVTADTHNIRGMLDALNERYPGEIPLEWLVPGARERYASTGVFDAAGDVDDSLKSAVVNGRKIQVEYGPTADLTFDAARLAGIEPGRAQALNWFGDGDKTNLQSSTDTVATLMDKQVNIVAQVLGVDPKEALKMLVEGRVPTMAEGGHVDRAALFDRYSD